MIQRITLCRLAPLGLCKERVDLPLLLEQAELMTPQESLADISCAVSENVRARLRVMVKRVLKKHGYPSDKQERATLTFDRFRSGRGSGLG